MNAREWHDAEVANCWTTAALTLSEPELAAILELQRITNTPKMENVIRQGLHHLAQYHGLKLGPSVFSQR